MEAQKDKHHSENESGQGHGHEHEHDAKEDAKQPATPKDTEKLKLDDVEEVNRKKEEEATNLKNVEASPPDFNKASEEIDQFISALSSVEKSDQSRLPDVPELFEHFTYLVEGNIANYDPVECAMIWSQEAEEESLSFLNSVDRVSKLAKLLGEFHSEPKYALASNSISGILHRAMCYLEDEFRYILEDSKFVYYKDHKDEHPNQEVAPGQQSPKETKPIRDDNFPEYSEEALSTLCTLRNAMAKSGYEAECYQVYVVSRRTILERTLHTLGYEKLSLEEMQKMQWDSLEGAIVSWDKAFKEFLFVQFPNERKLSEVVFSSDKALSNSLFNSIAHSIAVQLLNFAAGVAITKTSSQKMFKFIDIYDTLSSAIAMDKMQSLFPEETTNDIKSEASLTLSKLREAIVSMFSELEISIRADTGKNNVPGGDVHPLTRYIVNYLKYACDNKNTLEEIFKEHQKNHQDGSNDNQASGIQSPVALEINKVMDLLDANLDSKSKLYKDTSLSSIFMMNNGRYILQKMKGSPEIECLMGNTWTRKRSSDLRNFHKTYQRETWNKLLNCLSTEGLTANGKVMKPVLKEKFKSFTSMFDEIHKTQSSWVVSDEQLQSELRVSISAIVIPAYRSFLARFSGTFTPGRQTEKYIKYQPDDIETYIDELFDGNSNPTGRRR